MQVVFISHSGDPSGPYFPQSREAASDSTGRCPVGENPVEGRAAGLDRSQDDQNILLSGCRSHLVLVPEDSSVVLDDLDALAFRSGMLFEFFQQSGFLER